MTRATNAEISRRVDQIYTLMLGGASYRDILAHCEKHEWPVKKRMIDHYIQRARERFEQAAETKRGQEFGRALDRLEDLYSRNLKIQDYKAALAVVKERLTLLGLYPPAKSEVAITDWRASVPDGIDAETLFNQAIDLMLQQESEAKLQ